MSRSGMLLALEPGGTPVQLPVVGQAVRIVLELPRAEVGQRCVECLGRVVRVGQEEEALRVAFEFRRFQFTECNSSPFGSRQAVFS